MDANSKVLSNESQFYNLSKRLIESGTRPEFYWVKGGFKEFQSSFPSLVCASSGPLIKNSIKKPSLSLNSLGPLTTTATTASVTSASVDNYNQQFFNCLRQYNTATSSSAEKIPIQMPIPDVNSFGQCASTLPAFLQKMIEKDHGEKAIAELFEKLDVSEQKRLYSLTKTGKGAHNNPYSVSAGIEKGHKNRYMNIWPYENSRIKLVDYSAPESDYINASLITESITNNNYIATQGPLPATFEDFWQLIWQNNTRVIAMLTKEYEGGRIRCHRYWPDVPGQSVSFGKFVVKNLQEEECTNTGLIQLRKFLLSRSDRHCEPMIIMQVHYLGWPDFGVPAEPTTLLRVRNLTRHLQTMAEARFDNVGPMIVHCSAGCGRTGAFCAIDSSIAALDFNLFSGYPDIVYHIVESFRDQRISMVQTHRQLVLIYETLIWYLLSDRRCGDLSGLCPSLRHLDFTPLEIVTPMIKQGIDSYFSPSTITNNGDYFSIPSSSIAGVSTPNGNGFPF
ncbi:hypothetical protein K502DRAFT_326545 [Neoconidiobolus thromboides FSU 785]|nr:hypothetical protein K502DRAFT_326545 [Neoconidiobolus thromboides FSU 785]